LGQTTVDSVIPTNCYDPTTKQIIPGPSSAFPYGNPCATLSSTGTVNPTILPLVNLYPYANLPNNQFTYPSKATTSENYGQMRVDLNFSASDTLFARYTTDEGATLTPQSYPGYATDFAGRNQFATVSENHIFSPTVLSTARISYSRTPTNAIDLFPSQATGPQYSFVTGEPVGGIVICGSCIADWGGVPSLPESSVQNVYTASYDTYWTKGRHALKFGVLFNRFNISLTGLPNTRGSVNFPDVPSFLAGMFANQAAVTPGSLLHHYWTFNTLGFYAQDDFRVTPRLTLNLGLRYEFNTTPSAANTSRFTNFQTEATTTQGPVMRNASLKNFSPRVGFAWDVTGKGTTSLRGGAGLYYDVGNIGAGLNNQQKAIPPFVSSSSVGSGGPITTLPFDFAGAQGNEIDSIDYNSGQPKLVQYNLTAERQLPGAMALSVGYVGTRGFNLWTIREFNWNIPLSITNGVEFWGPDPSVLHTVNPNWGTASMLTAGADSWYNALEVELTKRASHGLEFQATYTWSQSLDDAQSQSYSNDCGINAPGSTHNVDPIFPIHDKGPSCTDQPNDFSFNIVYHFPNIKSDNFAARILHGWWVGSIVSIQSGLPFAPNVVGLISNSGVFAGDQGDRPNIVTPANLAAAKAVNPNAVVYNHSTIYNGGNTNQWFNTNMFTLEGPNATAPCNDNPANSANVNPNGPTYGDTFYYNPTCYFGYLGDSSRDMLRGPGLTNWDFSVNKDTRLPFLGENGKLEFRAEIFNILNHANFGLPNGTIFAGNVSNEAPLSNAGLITYTNTPSRQIQLALKIIF
jgi:hypothetical protein